MQIWFSPLIRDKLPVCAIRGQIQNGEQQMRNIKKIASFKGIENVNQFKKYYSTLKLWVGCLRLYLYASESIER